LFNVLKAYTILKPEVGYCQAQAPIAAFLLMHMPAEEAFWCFVAICDNYLSDYYYPGMVIFKNIYKFSNVLLFLYKLFQLQETLIQDGNILFALLKEREPNMYKLLVSVKFYL